MAINPGLKRAVKLILVNLSILIVLLCAVEIIFRVMSYPFNPNWAPSENAIARFDRELGWSYLPNLSKSVVFEDSEQMVFTDAYGIRVPSPGYRFSAEKPSILFVGCSYTMGHGLSFEENFVGQLAAYTGNPYQMVNLGVQAYGTDQAYLSLLKNAPRFNAKAVVYTFMDEHPVRNGSYDRRLLMPEVHLFGTKPLFALNAQNELYLAKKPLLFEELWSSYLFDALVMSVGGTLGIFPPAPEELTLSLIQKMAAYCKERDIRFVLLNWRWNKQGYNKFQSMGFDVIDTMNQAPEGWETMRIHGDNHPDAMAGRHVARLLHAKLKSVLQ